MTCNTKQATEGDVTKAIVEAGQALYLAEESTAKSVANGSSQELMISQNFFRESSSQVQQAIQSFENYEAQVQASQHTSFWGSLFGWVLTIVSLVASAFAGPEMFLFTVAMVIASKTGGLTDLQNDLAKVLGGSQLLAGILLTAAFAALGAGGGAAAGALEEDAGAVAEEVVDGATDDAVDTASESGEGSSSQGSSASKPSIGSRIASRIQRAIGSLSRSTAGGLNGLGQGLQNFNTGAEIAEALAKNGLGGLGIALDVIVNIVGIVAESAGTGNGMIRAAAAGRGVCGTSAVITNTNLFKAAGATGMTAALGEGSCSIASGAIQQKQADSLQAYIQAQGTASLFSSLKDSSHDAFSSWIDNTESLEKILGETANQVGDSISAVNTQLAIAMSGRG